MMTVQCATNGRIRELANGSRATTEVGDAMRWRDYWLES